MHGLSPHKGNLASKTSWKNIIGTVLRKLPQAIRLYLRHAYMKPLQSLSKFFK